MGKNSLQILLIIVLVSVVSGFIGFNLGRTRGGNIGDGIPNQELADLQSKSQNVANFYLELNGQEKGINTGNSQEKFNSAKMHFDSPLFEGKNMYSYTYQFKGDTIVEKSLDVGDGVTLYVAEYHPKNNSTNPRFIAGFPANFVTFSGYENYSLTPSYVGPRVMMWDDTTQYTPKPKSENDQEQSYYEEAEYTPRQIGNAVLTTYVRYFQGIKEANYPVLISLSKSLSSPVGSRNDSVFREAIDSLKPYVDTITYGIPQQ